MKHPAIPYVAPFAAFMAFLILERTFSLQVEVLYPIRAAVVCALIWLSRSVVSFRAANWLGSILLGIAVFVIWICPDALWPGYRDHWLFHNKIVGEVSGAIPDGAKSNFIFVLFRGLIGCTLAVPILEEIFWRGWLARWLVNSHDFREAPLGAYTQSSFWIGSLLFASEHGPYWEVGLIAGILYNWWMIRTKNLANCIVTHMTTNGCLSVYVLAANQWQYWM